MDSKGCSPSASRVLLSGAAIALALAGCAPSDGRGEGTIRVFQPAADIRIVPELTVIGSAAVYDGSASFRRAAEERARERGIALTWCQSYNAPTADGRAGAACERAIAVLLPAAPEALDAVSRARRAGVPLFLVGRDASGIDATCRIEPGASKPLRADAKLAVRLIDAVADYVRGLDVPRVIGPPSS